MPAHERAVSDEVERSSVRSAVGKDRADDIVIGVGLVDEAFPLLVHRDHPGPAAIEIAVDDGSVGAILFAAG